MTDSALDPIAHEIWDMKYRFKSADGTPIDQTVDDTWTRGPARGQSQARPLGARLS
jgi:hypothetical protein